MSGDTGSGAVRGAFTAPHDLPALRCARANEAAREIADRRGIDRAGAWEIAQAVINIIGEGTRRTGHRCTDCDSRIEWDAEGYRPRCPKCGALNYHHVALALEITFPPVPSSAVPGLVGDQQ